MALPLICPYIARQRRGHALGHLREVLVTCMKHREGKR